MITELALLSIGMYTYNYLNTIDERKLKHNFNLIMQGTGIKNKEEETFKISKITPTSYGYITYINIPKGLSTEHLNSKLNILEDNLNGIIDLDKDKFQPSITMRIVDKDIDKFPYEPVKCPSNMLYIGKDFTGKNYFIDLTKDSQILIAGVTGCGKSFLVASVLTNLIYNYPKDIEIYLSQIVKGDIGCFSNCNSVKFVAYNITEVMISLNKVCKILDERSKLLMDNGIRNITQWNNHFKPRRMKRIIYILEELSFFMEEDCVWGMILKIIKAGRSVGIHIIGVLQRSTADNINTTVKSQMTRISFRQKSAIDSNNIINTTDAVKLKERECIIDGNASYVMVKTPYIDEDFVLLHKYVPEIKIPNSPTQSDEEDNSNDKNPNNIEIVNINNETNQMLTLEEHIIVDVDVDVDSKYIKEANNKNNPKRKFKTGVMSMEEFERCSHQEIKKS